MAGALGTGGWRDRWYRKTAAPLVARITDVALRCTANGWAVEAVDTGGPIRRLLRASRRVIDWDVLAARRVLTRPVAVHRRRAGA